MHIQFERSGGFMGMRVRTSVDTHELPDELAEQFRQALYEADFFQLPDELRANPPGADTFRYRLTVDDGDRTHTVEMEETAAPEPLQPLLRNLTLIARRQKPRKIS
jgi:hypothetical protein